MKELVRIHKDILIYLDIFAGYTRYYNLDIVVYDSGKNQTYGEVIGR